MTVTDVDFTEAGHKCIAGREIRFSLWASMLWMEVWNLISHGIPHDSLKSVEQYMSVYMYTCTPMDIDCCYIYS